MHTANVLITLNYIPLRDNGIPNSYRKALCTCIYVYMSMTHSTKGRNTPKTRLNEILYIEKMLLPSLSSRLLPELTFRKNGFPFN